MNSFKRGVVRQFLSLKSSKNLGVKILGFTIVGLTLQ
jgi:hypothetical protein